jgi:hypothetical protein
MYSRDGIDYRLAEKKDAFPIMKLYQKTLSDRAVEPLFLDIRNLENALAQADCFWVIGERHGEVVAVLSLQFDRENRLAKIARSIVDPTWEDSTAILKNALPMLVEYMGSEKRGIDVLYTTTRAFDIRQQQLTLKLGFKVLGFFPGSAESTGKMNLTGLTAYFYEDVLEKTRFTDFSLHPLLAPLYEIARRESHLPALTLGERVQIPQEGFEPVPELEIIHAPAFVRHRFQELKQRKSLAVQFYPFTEPNVLVTDPEQRVEIFARVIPEYRFATIIGERLERETNPTELYLEVCRMLRGSNVAYIEVINDAADSVGIEAILDAGFLPCGYFPALKLQGDTRRDYAIFARSFERLFAAPVRPGEIHAQYVDYIQEYVRMEAEQYFDRMKPLSF